MPGSIRPPLDFSSHRPLEVPIRRSSDFKPASGVVRNGCPKDVPPPSESRAMSLLASLRSLGSHLRCAGGPLGLRAGMGQALGPAAAQMFVRGMKVRSAIKKRCEAMLKTRRESLRLNHPPASPREVARPPKASAAICQPGTCSAGRPLGSLLPAGSCCRPSRGGPDGLSSALASITLGARRATSSSGATSRTSTARPTRGTSSGRDPSISRATSSAPPRASRTGPRAASPGRERYNDARPSST